METQNSSHTANTSGDSTSLFSGSPYTTVEIVLIILVAGSLSLITVIGNILVMLSIKVWAFFFSSFMINDPSLDILKSIPRLLEHTQTVRKLPSMTYLHDLSWLQLAIWDQAISANKCVHSESYSADA